MSRKDLHRRWRRRLSELLEGIDRLFEDCRHGGSAEAIHDLRVAIRRARLYAKLGRPLLGKGGWKRFDHWGRFVSNLLGPVRDCDVVMAWLAGFANTEDLINVLHQERTALWQTVAVQLSARHLARVPKLVIRKEGADRTQTLARRYELRLAELRRGVLRSMELATLLKPARLHALRRSVRRWRYLRELALGARRKQRDRELALLNRVQDALGDAQNLRVASQRVGRLPRSGRTTQLSALARLAQQRCTARARRACLRLSEASLTGKLS